MKNKPSVYEQYINLHSVRMTDSLCAFVVKYKHVLELIIRSPHFVMEGLDDHGNQIAFILADHDKLESTSTEKPTHDFLESVPLFRRESLRLVKKTKETKVRSLARKDTSA